MSWKFITMENELITVEGLQVSPAFAKLLVIGSKPTVPGAGYPLQSATRMVLCLYGGDKPVPQLIEAAKAYYAMPNNGVGGSLHIVLDDENIEDGHINWCIDYAMANDDNEGVLLGKMLLGASYTQRRKLVRSYGAYCL
jgi:hypothetical protein